MTSPPTDPASANPKAKNIPNPRRLLILTPTSHSLSIIPPLLHSLTGVPVLDPPQQPTAPPQSESTDQTPTTTFAGYTTHSPLRLSTKYYTTEVPVWVDEIPLENQHADTPSAPTAEQWKTEFLSADAEIVREAVGALVVCAHNPSDAPSPPPGSEDVDPTQRGDVRALRDLMRGVGAVKERIDEERGGVGDVPGVLVLVGGRKGIAGQQMSEGSSAGLGLGVDDEDLGGNEAPFSVAWWEDQLFDMGLLGWEVVEWDPKEVMEVETRNQYGEREGMPRIREVLETHDWSMTSGASGLGDDSGVDSEDDLEDQLLGMSSSRGFGDEVSELEREMFGLRMAIERGGGDGDEEDLGHDDAEDEIDVESMEALMMRMQAIKDMSSELPEGERRRFAAKAVQDIMRDL
ncbi:Alpha/gamma-adaptin-binding protein p34 [Penicillium bovifimosum]|uniref:Alpha/gamma-adaptin-binding protein p34 n=1 Tax=Penicillium bovifimosum TaxID=126998 RepID=A0A9W9GSK5_9EURO|nr:Alpha/gamma-adaptin-binding protein p34 [Penicillium bovifimosum]KAJ5129330.1 Alpha/gamma-adaptin-binding protein p34 [Penicillium bovifimosum]